jgi:hypothetical protein
VEHREAADLAAELLARWGLEDWRFEFDHAVRRFGHCRFDARTISLSRHLVALNERPPVEDTILHEIAHARIGPSGTRSPARRPAGWAPAPAAAAGSSATGCFAGPANWPAPPAAAAAGTGSSSTGGSARDGGALFVVLSTVGVAKSTKTEAASLF